MTTAEELRVEGQNQAVDHADSRITAIIDEVIADACASGEEFSVVDIRAALPTVTSQGLAGARVEHARKAGLMRPVGFTRSDLKSTRGAYVRTWVGVR